MPIQMNQNRFLQFGYEPSYLKNDRRFQSKPKDFLKHLDIQVKQSSINLDGGNLINWRNKVMISYRIFDEHPEYSSKTKLIDDLQNLLETEVIVISQINSDFTGHKDGMIHFVDENTILGNDRSQEYKYWQERVNKVLKDHKLEYIDILFFQYKDKKHPNNAIGCYVNYLEAQDLIVFPIFEMRDKEDEKVVKLFQQILTDRTIETINYNDIGLEGELLNCATWTIKV